MFRLFSPEAEAELVRLIDERVAERLAEASRGRQTGSPWMTVSEAAEYLRTTPGAIYKRVKRGQLKGHRPEGSGIRLWREDLDSTGPQGRAVLSC